MNTVESMLPWSRIKIGDLKSYLSGLKCPTNEKKFCGTFWVGREDTSNSLEMTWDISFVLIV